MSRTRPYGHLSPTVSGHGPLPDVGRNTDRDSIARDNRTAASGAGRNPNRQSLRRAYAPVRQDGGQVTREDALDPNIREFHANGCIVTFGATGYAQPKLTAEVWRRNGQTQTWKTRPDAFRVPIKHGLYAYGEITQNSADNIHPAERCAALRAVEAWWESAE